MTFTEDQHAEIAKIAGASSDNVLKRYSRKALVGFLLLLVGVGFAVNGSHNALNDSRERGTKLRTVICLVLTQADGGLYEQHAEGKLSSNELTAALVETAEFRKDIGPAPGCLTTPTPPPVGLN